MATGTQGKGTSMQQCIDECTRCHAVCMEAITHCLEKGGRHAEPTHMRLLMDCSQICATSADFMLRGSDLHHLTCGACAEVCERCAEDCEKMADDPQMQECAEACRRCAESCSRMASAG